MRRSWRLPLVVVAASVLAVDCRPVQPSEEPAGQVSGGQPAAAQPERPERPGAWSERRFTGRDRGTMGYLFFVPRGYDPGRRYPLVVWLHGGGARGDDLQVLLSFGDAHGPGYLARPDVQATYPSFVLAPQCPTGEWWSDPSSAELTAEMRLVLATIEELRASYSLDGRRLYVIGMSLGGYGAWDVIGKRPGLFAAAVPICGGGDPALAVRSAGTPVWAFHGDQDEMVDVAESRRMVAAVRGAGGSPKYTEYPGVGHNAWVNAFAEPELMAWLFAQRLPGGGR